MYLENVSNPRNLTEITNLVEDTLTFILTHYSKKQKLGIRGELYAYLLLYFLLPQNKGYYIEPIDWKKYTWGFGADIKVYYKGEPFLCIEVKNFHKRHDPYGVAWLEEDVYPRFTDETEQFRFKALIVSYKECISLNALNELEKQSIHVFEFGCLVTDKLIEPFGERFSNSIKKLADFLEQIQKPFFWGIGFNGHIDVIHYLYNTSNTSTNNSNNTYLITYIHYKQKTRLFTFKMYFRRNNKLYCKEVTLS